jgi:RHS repeat-associated protein
VITDSAGNIKAESDYYPWGGELQFVNNDSNHYKFTGKERDSETQLDYFGARHYSNGLARWISADWSPTPIPVPYADFNNPQSLNLYGFVGGNPASKADPDGHADDNKSLWGQIVDALNLFGDALHYAHMGGSAAIPPPQPCPCPSQNKQDNKQNNNNSNQQSSTKNPSGQAGGKTSGPGKAPSRIDRAAFKSERASFWKAEAKANPEKYSAANLAKMEKGKPPTGSDGHPMELHHVDRTQNSPLEPMTRTDHRLGENFKKNHPE